MNGFTLFMLAVVVIGLPVTLGVGSEMLKRWLKHKEVMAQALTAETAERAAQYAAHALAVKVEHPRRPGLRRDRHEPGGSA